MKIKDKINGGRKAALNSMKLTLEVYNELKQKVIFFYNKLGFIKYEKTKGRKLAIALQIRALNRKPSHWLKHTDSTDIPVCLNKNAAHHKTMYGLASWGHSGKGFYYGLKLHLTTDWKRNILSFSFTSANGSDRSQFMKLNKYLEGIFAADAGYTSEELEREFFQENKRILFAKPRKNMKKLMTYWQ